MYEKIKRYYDMGIYTKEDLQVFLNAKYITKEEHGKIIGLRKRK